MGKYELTVTASIPQPSDPSGSLTVSTTFIAEIGDNCYFASFIDRPFNDMTVLVSQATSQSIVFQDTKAVFYNLPGYCGDRSYTFTGGLPSFLQLDSPVTTLTLSTNDPSDVGVKTVKFYVGLVSRPNVTPLLKTF